MKEKDINTATQQHFFICLLSTIMQVWLLLCLCLTITQAQKLITFGIGRSSNRLFLAEVSVDLITLDRSTIVD